MACAEENFLTRLLDLPNNLEEREINTHFCHPFLEKYNTAINFVHINDIRMFFFEVRTYLNLERCFRTKENIETRLLKFLSLVL